jgi:hypothetical protein
VEFGGLRIGWSEKAGASGTLSRPSVALKFAEEATGLGRSVG